MSQFQVRQVHLKRQRPSSDTMFPLQFTGAALRKITVYAYECFSEEKGAWLRVPYLRGTLLKIESMRKCRPLMDDFFEIDQTALRDGLYLEPVMNSSVSDVERKGSDTRRDEAA